jgi:hypothetical protein
MSIQQIQALCEQVAQLTTTAGTQEARAEAFDLLFNLKIQLNQLCQQ